MRSSVTNIINFLSCCFVSFDFKRVCHNVLRKGSNDRNAPILKSHILGLIYNIFFHDISRYHSEEGSDELLSSKVAENQWLYFMLNPPWQTEGGHPYIENGCNPE